MRDVAKKVPVLCFDKPDYSVVSKDPESLFATLQHPQIAAGASYMSRDLIE